MKNYLPPIIFLFSQFSYLLSYISIIQSVVLVYIDIEIGAFWRNKVSATKQFKSRFNLRLLQSFPHNPIMLIWTT